MSRARQFLGGVLAGYFNQALVLVVTLWLTPFLLGRLGQEDYGFWLLATQIVSYVGILDLGVIALVPREVAFTTASPDGGGLEKTRSVIRQAAWITVFQTPLVALAAFGVWKLLPGEWQALERPLAIILVAFVACFPLRILAAVLNGLQDLAYASAASTVVWLGTTCLTVGLVLRGHRLEALALGWATGQVLLALSSGVRLLVRHRAVLPSSFAGPSWGVIRLWLARSVWVSATQVAQALLQGTDIVVIGRTLGATATVPYACTGKLVNALANQPNLIMNAAGPGLSQLRAGHRDRILDVCSALALGMLVVSGAVFCLVLVVNEGFVGWWVDPDRFGGSRLTLALLASMLLRHWNTTATYSVFAFGYERRIAITVLLDGVVTVGLSVGLVRSVGPIGAPLASIVGVTLVALPLNLRVLAREGQTSVPKLVTPLLGWFWRFALLAGAAYGLAPSLTPETPPRMVLAAGGVAVVYLAVMLPLVLRSPLASYLPQWLQRLARRSRLV